LILTRSALRTYLERGSLDGAKRLLREWFSDVDRSRGKPGPKPQRRDHLAATMLGDLATLTRNVVRLGRDPLTAPTPSQHRALDRLALTPPRRQTGATRCKLYQCLRSKGGKVRFNESRPPDFTGALRRRGEAWEEPSAEDKKRLDEAYRSGEF